MAGFLDKKTRILDVVLTNYGKSLLARGQLNFCYWSAFDDEIDYDPYVSNSASLTEDQLDDAIASYIESTPIREATTGYRVFNSQCSDFTNVHRPLFTRSQGQEVLPRAVFPISGSFSITTLQRRLQTVHVTRDENGKYVGAPDVVDNGVERFDSSFFTMQFSYGRDSFSTDFQPEGFFIRMYKSGSDGFVEVGPRRDLNNDVTYGSDVKVFTGRMGG